MEKQAIVKPGVTPELADQVKQADTNPDIVSGSACCGPSCCRTAQLDDDLTKRLAQIASQSLK